MTRNRPVGWRNEPIRHSMASRGIKTNFTAKGIDRYVPDYLPRWKRASNYGGTDYSDYYIAISINRDSNLLEKSNWDVFIEYLKDEDGVEIIRLNHWAVGWIEQILIHKDAKESLMIADELCEQLERYPVLDEDDFVEREYDAIIDNIMYEGGINDKEARLVYSYLWDNNPEAVESHDLKGGYPSGDDIKEALKNIRR